MKGIKMRKLFIILTGILFFVLLIVPASSVKAQDSSLFEGQEHSYSVHLRSNGEAIVTSRITFYNNEETPKDTLKLEIEGQLTELYIAQIVLPKVCNKYDYSSPKPVGDAPYKCLEYSEQDTYDSYSYNYAKKQYYKISPKVNGTKYELPLNTPVKTGSKSTILLAYATKSYVKNGLGNKIFDIPTIKADQRIKKAEVAVTFDDDIYYEGKRATTQYKEDISNSLSSMSSGATANSQLDRNINIIGSLGTLTKQASSLAPGDVFRVKGTYATSWLGMYYKRLLAIILGIAGFIALLWFIGHIQQKRINRKESKNNSPEDNSKEDVKESDEPISKTEDAKEDKTVKSNSLATDTISKEAGVKEILAIKQNGPKLFGTDGSKYIYVFRIRMTNYFATFILSLFTLILTLGLCFIYGFVAFKLANDAYLNPETFVGTIKIILFIAGLVLVFLGTFTIIPVWLVKKRGWKILYVFLISITIWLLIIIGFLGLINTKENQDYYDDTRPHDLLPRYLE